MNTTRADFIHYLENMRKVGSMTPELERQGDIVARHLLVLEEVHDPTPQAKQATADAIEKFEAMRREGKL